MTPQKFKERWTNNEYSLVPLTPSRLERFNLSKASMDFLSLAGFPKYAGPCLSFINDSDEKFKGISKVTEIYDMFDKTKDYEKYIVISYCNDGNVIAINTEEYDQLEELDHGDLFASNFFNSSLSSLAAFLILYKNFENLVLVDKDPDDGMQFFNFTDNQFATLKELMLHFDERAVMAEGFWKNELEGMLLTREEYFGSY